MSGVVGNVIGTGIKMLHYETGINECEHVETDSTFDLESNISASWYPQFMNEQYYQRIEDYNCTSATYHKRKSAFRA